jgi:hypothetical protein
MQKTAAVKIKSTDSGSSPYKTDGVRGIAEFRPSLSQILRSPFNMASSRCKRKIERCRLKPSTSLVSVSFTGFFEYRLSIFQVFLVCQGDLIDIMKGD